MASYATNLTYPQIMNCPNNGSNNCSDGMGASHQNITGQEINMDLRLYFYLVVPVATFLYASIFVVGVIGNFLVCLAVAKYKDMRDNIFHIFLANLSIADLLVVAVCVPTAMVDVFSEEIWYLGSEMCKAVPFLEYSVAHSSVLTILAISFERFLAIIYPLKAHYVSSRVRSIIMIIFIWIIAFLSSIPFAYMAEYTYSLHEGTGRNETVCQNRINSPLKQIYLFSTSAIFFAIPFYILCVLYAFISHHLIRDSYKSLGVATDSSAYNLKARRSAVLMLATVVGTFFVCLLPFRVLQIWMVYAQESGFIDAWYTRVGASGYYGLLYFARVMFYLNSASNPIVLYFMSAKFRAKFRHILCCEPLPVPNFPGMSRSGTFRYSLRTEKSNSIRRPEYAMHHYTPSFTKRTRLTNGNGNVSASLSPIEEMTTLMVPET